MRSPKLVVAPMLAVLALTVSACLPLPSQNSTGAASSSVSTSATQETPSARQIIERMTEAVDKAEWVTIKATGVIEGVSVALDLYGRTDGSASAMQIVQDGARSRFIFKGTDAWVNADAQTWTSQGRDPSESAELESKWVKLTRDEFMSLEGHTSKEFLSSVFEPGYGDQFQPNVETKDVDGQKVYVLTVNGGPEKGQLLVRADGSYLPVRATGSAAGDSSIISFTKWNESDLVAAPAPADVVDLLVP